MVLVQKGPKSIKIGTTAIKKVYLGSTFLRPGYSTTTDYTTTSTSITSMSKSANYRGLKFTALKDGYIKQVEFFRTGLYYANLKIAQGNYASASGTTYYLNGNTPGGIFTLSTPYAITAGNSYVIVMQNNNSTYLSYYVTGLSLPVSGTAVRYDYSTIDSNTNQYTNLAWVIRNMTIDYIP